MSESEITGRQYTPSPREWVRIQVEMYEATDGAEGSILDGRPVVILTSVGAKSGAIRKSPIMRVERDGVYAAIASAGGAARNPSWYLNLLANPDVELQDGPARLRLRARGVAGAEKDVWWTIADALSSNYAKHRAGDGREIPILVLEPVGTAD